MKTTANNEINDIVAVIEEANLFLKKRQEENGEISKHLYLLNDISDAIKVVLHALSQDNKNNLSDITEELIRNIEYSLGISGSNFNTIGNQIEYWLGRIILEVSERYYSDKEYEIASEGYLKLTSVTNEEIQAISFHRLGQIYSTSDPMRAFVFYKDSFRINNRVAKYFVTKDHPSFHYTFEEVNEVYTTTCQFCKQEAKPYFCAESFIGLSYNKMYSPVKVWMRCDSCNQSKFTKSKENGKC